MTLKEQLVLEIKELQEAIESNVDYDICHETFDVLFLIVKDNSLIEELSLQMKKQIFYVWQKHLLNIDSFFLTWLAKKEKKYGKNEKRTVANLFNVIVSYSKELKEDFLLKVQVELFRMLDEYMKNENINRTQLAERLGVSKSYITQIMNGNFDHRLSKLVELCLFCGKKPSDLFS